MSSTPQAASVRLAGDEAHVLFVSPEQVARDAPARLDAYLALLSPDERARHARFHFERHRLQYLVAHALVRTALSRFAPHVAPHAWTFLTNAHGCPRVAPGHAAPPLEFNLSHTDGLVVCIVALAREVGVDVEDTTRPGETVEIADRFFAPAEHRALRALGDAAAMRDRFFDYWTLKEAYIKARGMGLAIPLDAFAFDLDPARARAPTVTLDPSLADDASSWQFAQFRPTAHHRVAAAVRRRDGQAVRFVLREFVPPTG